MESKRVFELAKRLEGPQTISSIQNKLGMTRATAIKTVHLLRKEGLVKTSGGGEQPRIYKISRTPYIMVGGPGLYDIINKYSKIKLTEPFKHRIMDREMSIEEAIVRAVLTGDYRVILASLGLFNHVKNWPLLYALAKREGIRRKIGALYDTARKTVKVRKMDKKIREALIKAKEKSRFIIPGIKSHDFMDIEKTWKIHIPFNKADLWRYKE